MTICGTPSWVAPEIFRGEQYNETVDVYSFAITLLEVVCVCYGKSHACVQSQFRQRGGGQ